MQWQDRLVEQKVLPEVETSKMIHREVFFPLGYCNDTNNVFVAQENDGCLCSFSPSELLPIQLCASVFNP